MSSRQSKEKNKKAVNIKNGPNTGLAEYQQNGVDSNQYYLDVDPDLQTDVEIVLPKDHRAVSRTTMSAKSRKTAQSGTGRQSEARENIVRSRGRPIKPHETEPFLSINTLPPEKSFVSEKSTIASNPAHSRASKPAPQINDESRSLEAQLQRMTAYMSPYHQQTPAPPRSVPSRTGRVTPANTPYHSPNKSLRPPNHHVKSPFKHAVNQPDLSLDRRQTPSMGMKERTALAAFHVHKMLSVAGEKDVHKVAGKLQKGKLKPLYPVKVEGPTIEKCRGIISEARSYQPSPSRTLQRRVNLLNKVPNVHEYLYERPRTVESVHQTSVASSIDENFGDDQPATNRSLPDEILYAQEASILEPKTPENTFFPEPTQEEIVEGVQIMGVERTPTMFATEVGSRDPETADNITVSDHVQHELQLSESAEKMQETQEITEDNRNNSYVVETVKIDTELTQVSVEEKTRVGSPSKSVRFAEQRGKAPDTRNSKEMKEMVNENIAKQQRDTHSGETRNLADMVNDKDVDTDVIETVSRKNKQNSKGSCKSEGDEAIFRKDDESDDEDWNNKDDSGKTRDNYNRESSAGNTCQSNESENKENMSSSNKNSGQKRAVSAHQIRSRSASGSRLRSKSREQNFKHSGNNSQVRKKRPNSASNTKSASQGSHCSRFEQSKASSTHTHTLEISSVIHGDTVATVLGPESPKRARSRSASPSRRRDQTFQFFSHRAKPCFEEVDEFSSLHGNTQRSKVKFMLEGEEPEMDTIFIEDEDDINVKPDKEITYDVLDSEIEILRSAIQNALISNEVQTEEDEITSEQFCEEEAELIEESDTDTVVMETENVDTIRGDYSNLLEKYRQRCMDRSEKYGAISTSLVTPRDTQSLTSSRSRSLGNETNKRPSNKGSDCKELSKDKKSYENNQTLNNTILSDSGHGSVDNLSDFSVSTSQARTDVPKLDLGGSTSDLGLGSGRSDVTVSTKNMEENDGEEEGEKTLLEMVCDQLSPVEQRQKPAKRREILRQIMFKNRLQREEDVSDLKIVATTKSLSKNSKRKGPSLGAVQASFPPVCFTINARPPKGYLYYFAYGPDMNPNRFSSYIQRDIQDRYWGLLFGFNLVFNKRGTSEEAGGFANLEFNPLRSVEGCIYKITPQELQVLDKCVGYPQHYEHLVLPVWLSNSSDADSLGVAQYCVPALTYIAQNSWTETEKPLNCDYALSQCIKSADIVTTAYKDSLVAMATQQQVTVSA